MSEQDEFDKQAEMLSPCAHKEAGYAECLAGVTDGFCNPCLNRPGIAAALREQGKQRADLRAENERLNKDRQRLIDSNEHWHKRVELFLAERDQLKAQLEEKRL